MSRASLVLILPLLALGCGRSAPRTPAADAATPAAFATATPVAEEATPATLKGTVRETLDSGGYTYLRLDTEQGEIWAAVNQAKVEKGAVVTIVNATSMDGFESRTLKRKFDRIVFGSLATGAQPGGMGGDPHAGLRTQPVEPGPIRVDKAEGPDARAVAEIFAQRAALKDKTVSLRGKVVKYNPGILGRNWVHLRDGSGSREGKDDDITVTTTDSAALGDVVLVRGTVRLDKDFGAGYLYPVIVEDAKILK